VLKAPSTRSPARDPVTDPATGMRWLDARLATIRDEGRWRAHREFDALGPRGTWRLRPDGVPASAVVSFASNDYLGLSTHPACGPPPTMPSTAGARCSGASRLVTGDRPVHEELERTLAEWKGTERAVLFPTGFAANLGVLTTLGRPACASSPTSSTTPRSSTAPGWPEPRCHRSRHGDLDALERCVAAPRIAGPGGRHGVLHGWRCRSTSRGLPHLPSATARCWCSTRPTPSSAPSPIPRGLDGVEVVRIGTCPRRSAPSAGSQPARTEWRTYWSTRPAPAIFTTGLSPADAAPRWPPSHIVRGAEGDDLRATAAPPRRPPPPGHPSPIVPIVLGDEQRARRRIRQLLDAGLLVPAIRPPTVAPGTSRLRVTLSAAHTDDEVDHLVTALAHLTGAPP
jgi:8-amino-7-oxononanoate synthase